MGATQQESIEPFRLTAYAYTSVARRQAVLSLPVQLAVVLVLGIASQWIAWRLRWPAILVLLLAGIAAGPGLSLIDPDAPA